MTRRSLAAVMACRADSSRLYAKPLQNIDVATGQTILEHKLDTFAALDSVVDQSVIAIAEGIDNLPYQVLAEKRGVPYLFGSKADILSRLINAGLYVGATDVLRVTSENPFLWWETLEEAWEIHLRDGNDVTGCDGCPWGSYFEIIRLDTLLQIHPEANAYQREACTQFFRDHPSRFKIRILEAPPPLARLDIRLSVDNPEDLVVCRSIYQHFQEQAPLIPLAEVIGYWDQNPSFRNLLAPLIHGKGIWIHNEGCAWASAS